MRPTAPPPPKWCIPPPYPLTSYDFSVLKHVPYAKGIRGHRCCHVRTRRAHFVKSHDSPKTALVFTTTPLPWFSRLTTPPSPDLSRTPVLRQPPISALVPQPCRKAPFWISFISLGLSSSDASLLVLCVMQHMPQAHVKSIKLQYVGECPCTKIGVRYFTTPERNGGCPS